MTHAEEKEANKDLIKTFNDQMTTLSKYYIEHQEDFGFTPFHMQNLQIFMNAMCSRDQHYEGQNWVFYKEVKLQFEILMLEMHNPSISHALKKRVLQDLFDNLGVCSGVKSHIEDANAALQELKSIDELLAKFRYNQILQFSAQHSKDKHLYGGYPVHADQAFLLHAAKLGINQKGFESVENINDIYLDKAQVSEADYHKFEKWFFETDYTPETCLKEIATYLYNEISLRLKSDTPIKIASVKAFKALFKGIPFVADNPYYFFEQLDLTDQEVAAYVKLKVKKNPYTLTFNQEQLFLIPQKDITTCICHMLIEKYQKNLYEHRYQKLSAAEAKEIGALNNFEYVSSDVTFSGVKGSKEMSYVGNGTETYLVSAVFPPPHCR